MDFGFLGFGWLYPKDSSAALTNVSEIMADSTGMEEGESQNQKDGAQMFKGDY